MKPTFRLLAVLAVFSFATLACSLTSRSADSLTTPSAAPRVPVATTGPTVLFEDDFSDASSGWDRYSDDTTNTDYLENGYQIKVDETNFYTWSNPGKTFSDVRVEVDAWKAAGPDGDAAVICRYQDKSNFYLLGITTDGYYGITKIKDDEDTLLGSDQLEFSKLIKTDAGAVNHLRADCVGNRLTLFVNGEILADVSDADFTSGDVGLAGGTYEEAGTDMRFDNFIVYRP